MRGTVIFIGSSTFEECEFIATFRNHARELIEAVGNGEEWHRDSMLAWEEVRKAGAARDAAIRERDELAWLLKRITALVAVYRGNDNIPEVHEARAALSRLGGGE